MPSGVNQAYLNAQRQKLYDWGCDNFSTWQDRDTLAWKCAVGWNEQRVIGVGQSFHEAIDDATAKIKTAVELAHPEVTLPDT